MPEVQRIQVHANSPLGVDGVAHDEEWGRADANETLYDQGKANASATRRSTGLSPTGGGYFTLTMPSIAEPTDHDGNTQQRNHTTAPIRIDAVVSHLSHAAMRHKSHTYMRIRNYSLTRPRTSYQRWYPTKTP